MSTETTPADTEGLAPGPTEAYAWAEAHVKHLLEAYEVETVGVYIQDVKLPAELVTVLKEREIANQTVENARIAA